MNDYESFNLFHVDSVNDFLRELKLNSRCKCKISVFTIWKLSQVKTGLMREGLSL